jgi:hypothetical protein
MRGVGLIRRNVALRATTLLSQAAEMESVPTYLTVLLPRSSLKFTVRFASLSTQITK